MPKTGHTSEGDLILFADGEMDAKGAQIVEMHLRQCVDCRSRLEQLKAAADAYTEYHNRLLKPSLEPSREWPHLQFEAPESSKPGRRLFSWSILIPASICALIVLAVLAYRDAPQRRATQLLTKAAESPASSHRRLQVTFNGQSLYRPAVLQTGDAANLEQNTAFEPTRVLFVRANYNWDDPLSARSFATWRGQLRNKHDQVVSLNSGDGRDRLYRVRTDTTDGVLRVASLTLRADTLHPVDGWFHFENDEDVRMAEAGEMPAERPITPSAKTASPQMRQVERKVSPEDELRVFAALDAVGADAGEPVSVNIDPSQQRVIVSGIGVPQDRQQEIRQALAGLPNAMTHFNSGDQSAATKTSVAPDIFLNNSAPLRHELELKAGGAQAFQDLADRALDASSSLLAQAHALLVLGQTFPPTVESGFGAPDEATLVSLRHHHAALIQQIIARLRTGLSPLLNLSLQESSPLETRTDAQTSWQAGADRLFTQSKQLDTSLAHLLGGSYSQTAGEDILARLPNEIHTVESLARAEAMQ